MKINLLIILILLFSCSSENQKNIKTIIPKKSFIVILKDVHLAEANYELTKLKNIDFARKSLAIEYSKIYLEYNITQEEFKRSLNYYANQTEDLEKIYSIIIDSLIQEKSIVNP